MIQRIQTLFLLLAAAALAGLFGLPFASTDQARADFLADKQYDIYDSTVLLAITILGIALALVAVFLFKKRKTQLTLGYIVALLCVVLPVAVILLFLPQYQELPGRVVEEELGLFLPALGLIFVLLATRYIKKDEALVRSMDRLR